MKHKLVANTSDMLFIVTTEGDGDVEGIISFLKDIISHPEWKPGFNILLDHQALEIDTIKSDGISKISSYFKSISSKLGSGKIALVMKRDIDFGITRIWEMITEPDVDIKIRVFRGLEKAKAWLDE
jgi:hypothetical protein